jgi:hypothetical protein
VLLEPNLGCSLEDTLTSGSPWQKSRDASPPTLEGGRKHLSCTLACRFASLRSLNPKGIVHAQRFLEVVERSTNPPRIKASAAVQIYC